MPKYIVRVWMDLKIEAESEKKAKELAYYVPIDVKENDKIEYYDSQVGEAWTKDEYYGKD